MIISITYFKRAFNNLVTKADCLQEQKLIGAFLGPGGDIRLMFYKIKLKSSNYLNRFVVEDSGLRIEMFCNSWMSEA